ncbi:MAG: putative Ig domain-containing protein [Comamonadaceae bacterium]|nr:putative Ig domain-containing protein [Comamonadaceae bacterium]
MGNAVDTSSFVFNAGTGSFQLPADAFVHGELGGDLSFSATLAGGDPLPSWLSFNPTTGVFSGNPPHGATSPSIVVTATDAERQQRPGGAVHAERRHAERRARPRLADPRPGGRRGGVVEPELRGSVQQPRRRRQRHGGLHRDQLHGDRERPAVGRLRPDADGATRRRPSPSTATRRPRRRTS